MGFDLDKRIAIDGNLIANDPQVERDQDAATHVGKDTRVEMLRRLTAELERRILQGVLGADEVAPPVGKRSTSDDMFAGQPQATPGNPTRARYEAMRAEGLREVVATVDARVDAKAAGRLGRATVAAADPSIASRAALMGPLPRAAARVEPDGRALAQVAERRAATLYRQAADSSDVDHSDPVVDEALERAGRGTPLPTELKKQMEDELGYSLDRVRVHTDAVAQNAARAVRADAFTVGEDIFFASGTYAPDTRDGQKLLAHELGHVVQALEGRARTRTSGVEVSDPNESLEREAEAVAERIDRRVNTARAEVAPVRAVAPTREVARNGAYASPTRARPLVAPVAPVAAAPLVRAAPVAPVGVLMRRAAAAAGATPAQNQKPPADAKKNDDPNAGQQPTLQVSQDRSNALTPKDHTADIRAAGADLTNKLKDSALSALGPVAQGIAHAASHPIGAKAAEHAHREQTNARQKQTAGQNEEHAALQAGHGGNDHGAHDATPHANHGGADHGGGGGGIQLKQISDYTPYMPAPLPDQDARETKRIEGLVKKKVNDDRKDAATALEHLRKAQLKQAAAVRGMGPKLTGQVAGAQGSALGKIAGSETTQIASVQSHSAGVQAAVAAHATSMKARITQAHAAALNQIQSAANAAKQKLQESKTRAITDIGAAEQDAIAAARAQVLATKTEILAVGNQKGAQARGLGDSVALPYEGDKLEAARKAARETAGEYASAMPSEASKAAEQVGAAEPQMLQSIAKIATDQRAAVEQAYTAAKTNLEQAEKTSRTAADNNKNQAVAGVDSAAASTRQRLASSTTAAVAGIRSTAGQSRTAITNAGKNAQQNIAQSVQQAAQGVEKGAKGVEKGARALEAPSPEQAQAIVTQGMADLRGGAADVQAGLTKAAQQAGTGLTTQATEAAQGLATAAQGANAAATQVGDGAKQSMTQAAENAANGLTQLAQQFGQQAEQMVQQTNTGLQGVVKGTRDAYKGVGDQLRESLSNNVTQIKASFNQAVPAKETEDILKAAKKAADAVKPWWQKALAVVVQIVVAVAVSIVIAALIVTTGPVGAILVGALAGALGSVAGQMASNLVLGNDLTEGITWQSVAMGAIGGGIGAGLTAGLTAGSGALASNAGRLAGAAGRMNTALTTTGGGAVNYGIRVGANVASDQISDAAAQLIVTGKYEFSVEGLVTSIATNAITSTPRFEAVQQQASGRVRTTLGLPPINPPAPPGGGGPGGPGGGPGPAPGPTPNAGAQGGNAGGPAPGHPAGGTQGGNAGGPGPAPAPHVDPAAQPHGPGAGTQGANGQPPAGPQPGQPQGGTQGGQNTGGPAPQGGTQGGQNAGGPAPQGGTQGGQNAGAPAPHGGTQGGQNAGTPAPHGGTQGGQNAGTPAPPGPNAGGPAPQAGTQGGQAPAPHPADAGAQGGQGARPPQPDAGAQGGTAPGAHPEAAPNAHPPAPQAGAQGGQAHPHADAGTQAGAHPAAEAGAPGGGHTDPAHAGNDGPDAAARAGDGGDADGPVQSQGDGELSELGYPNATRENADAAAAAVEGGGTPRRETVRDTEANQQGLADLTKLVNDTSLPPEVRAKAREDIAQRMRAGEEPPGNIAHDVAEVRRAIEEQQATAVPKDGAEADATTAPKGGAEADATAAPKVGDEPAAADATTAHDAAGDVTPEQQAALKNLIGAKYDELVTFARALQAEPSLQAHLARHTPEEIAAMVGYTSDDYRVINRALRSGDPAELARLESYIGHADRGLGKLSDFQGTVFRGADLSPEKLARYQVGETVVEPAFTSSSYDTNSKFPGNVEFVIQSKTGKQIDFLSYFQAEKEVLFRPGTSFKVLNREIVGGKTIITMAEAGAGGAPPARAAAPGAGASGPPPA